MRKMKQSVYISNYLIYPDLNEDQIRALSGALLHGLFIDQPIPRDKFAEIVEESEIPLNVTPNGQVVKMAKQEHVDAFFQSGSLRLGTFRYYNKFDHGEIGDTQEGSFILVGRCPPKTAFVEISGGFNYYVFCCFNGELDGECLQRFGYNSGFRITDVAGFSAAIQKQIRAIPTGTNFSRCAYSKDKVVAGKTDPNFNLGIMSARLLNLANEAKYFVKPNKYAHQSEFRFIWQMPEDVETPLDIKCPEAVKFCERI